MNTPSQIEGWCSWCGVRFIWTPTGQGVPLKRFCSKKHKRRAGEKAARIRESLTPGVCPTPGKLTFLTRRAAEQVLVQTPSKHRGARPYLCSCDFYHLGHIRKQVPA